jgi:hypothetical protein
LPPFSTHLAASVGPDTNKGESSRKWNGLHSPVSVQSRLNLSIEVPSPSQVYSYSAMYKSGLHMKMAFFIPSV